MVHANESVMCVFICTQTTATTIDKSSNATIAISSYTVYYNMQYGKCDIYVQVIL